ncbi:MAG: hypothetical protein Q4F31_00665 [Eubacteriales bacterium]|nr:hypothetical protein [Eubacteriales bacterium]
MTLFIVLFLLLVAVIIYIIGGNEKEDYYNPYSAGASSQSGVLQQGQALQQNFTDVSPAVQQMPSQQYVQPVHQQEVTPAPAPMPTPTPTPVPTPEPTPVPTPTPQPVGMAAGSGSFRSESGTLLNVHCDWSAAVADESNVNVTMTLYVDHYQLDYSAYKAVVFTLGESSQTIDGEDIHYFESGLRSTPVGTATFSVPAARGETKSLPLTARWSFGGQYGDGNGNKVDIDHIQCGGTVTISR